MENNKKLKIIVIISSIIILGLGNYIIYSNFVKKDSINNQETPDIEKNNENEEPIVLNAEDVKKWLNDNYKIIMYFTDFQNNFDYLNATQLDYTDFLFWYLVFGEHDTEEYLPYDNETVFYNNKYSLTKENAENAVKSFVRYTLKEDFDDVIDFSSSTDYSKDYYNFYSDDNNYYVEVLATGFDSANICHLETIELNENSEIEVTYGVTLNQYYPDEIKEEEYLYYRRLTLEKNDDSYRILKAQELAK